MALSLSASDILMEEKQVHRMKDTAKREAASGLYNIRKQGGEIDLEKKAEGVGGNDHRATG